MICKVLSMSKPKITIIIPVYNCIDYLSFALESVISQRYDGIDIILVDDGSDDGSSLLCDELSAKYDRVKALHKKNGGAASARNAGLDYYFNNESDLSEGYIAFLDSDDAWMQGFIDDNVVESMREGIDIISFQTCSANSVLKRRGVPTPVKPGDNTGGAENVWSCGSTSFAAALYRTEFLKEYDLRFESIRANEDVIFSLYSHYLAASIRVIEKVMYLYRSNSASVTHTRKYGISMYAPIIKTLLSADEKMSKYSSSSRGELRSCKELARIYIDDMISEHFAVGGKIEALDEWKSSPYLTETERDIADDAIAGYSKFKIMKLRSKHKMKSFARYIFKFKPLARLADIRRFPIKM